MQHLPFSQWFLQFCIESLQCGPLFFHLSGYQQIHTVWKTTFQFQKNFMNYFIDDSPLFTLLSLSGTPPIWMLNLLDSSSNFLIFCLLSSITFCSTFWEISTLSFNFYCFSISTLIFFYFQEPFCSLNSFFVCFQLESSVSLLITTFTYFLIFNAFFTLGSLFSASCFFSYPFWYLFLLLKTFLDCLVIFFNHVQLHARMVC